MKGSELARMWRVRKYGEVEWREGRGEIWVHQFMTLRISLLLPLVYNIQMDRWTDRRIDREIGR
jgi:hypothetical protein